MTVPAAGLAPPPSEQPASAHVYGLASHLLYGLTTELARKLVRGLL